MKNRKKDALITVGGWLTSIKSVPHPPYVPDLALCDFWLFSGLKEKLRSSGLRYIEKMEEAVTRVLDTFTVDDFHGALTKWLECYKSIKLRESYFED